MKIVKLYADHDFISFCHNLTNLYLYAAAESLKNNVTGSIHTYAAITPSSGLDNGYAFCFGYNRKIMHLNIGIDFGLNRQSRPSISDIIFRLFPQHRE